MVTRKTSPESSKCTSSCSPYDKVIVQYRSTLHFCGLRVLLDELEIYQPLTTDTTQMKQYHEELTVAIYLFSLSPDLNSQIKGQILGADSVRNL